jgi:hypothetical protein
LCTAYKRGSNLPVRGPHSTAWSSSIVSEDSIARLLEQQSVKAKHAVALLQYLDHVSVFLRNSPSGMHALIHIICAVQHALIHIICVVQHRSGRVQLLRRRQRPQGRGSWRAKLALAQCGPHR